MTDFLGAVAAGVVASAIVVLAVWVLYGVVYASKARSRGPAACFWLPAWRCFRLVVRNMDGSDAITAIRYRAWLRAARPATAGSSVTSWSDRELCSGERILLPKREDLTVLSFRCAQDQSAPALLVTDKFGSVAERVELEPEQASLMLEFSLRLRTWFLFKVDVGRVYEMKRYETRADKLEDAFLTLLPALQSGGETALERFALTDEAISVAL